ncbi:uracil-DNA glycosylase [Halolamina sp. CBA1230]|uniref:uracil-DNA glycosylase n=1 Tax=Halolamina sp. CBA1230 TaxID=1853690 RepID=UPI0009A1D9FD|nr:uracil-DNA glycosylase family protein [Halolamina sp. CBA1230]QKY20397.1 uracil-DNA glycosylase [Halolamina sp. CBA1230]
MADDPAFPDPDSALVLEPGCERCPDLAACRNRIAWGNGPEDAEVLVVGEAPGAGIPDADCSDAGRPSPASDKWRGGNWTGLAYTAQHSGRRIRETMAAVGYPDAFFTNAVKCFPADPDDPSTNREPTAAERENCRDHLRTEIDHVDPDAVVATGKHAAASMLAFEDRTVDGFVDSVLEPVRLDSLDVMLVPILHPAYRDVWLSRLGYDREAYLDDLRTVLDAAVEG